MIEVGLIADRMKLRTNLNDLVKDRGLQLQNLGFGGVDALHLACAERARADVFLTTDDSLLKRALRLKDRISVPVENPLRWFEREVK